MYGMVNCKLIKNMEIFYNFNNLTFEILLTQWDQNKRIKFIEHEFNTLMCHVKGTQGKELIAVWHYFNLNFILLLTWSFVTLGLRLS